MALNDSPSACRQWFRLRAPKIVRIAAGRFAFYGAMLYSAWWWMIQMPGRSAEGPPLPLPSRLRGLASELRRDVRKIAGEIGERNVPDNPERLEEAAAYIESAFQTAGYTTQSQWYGAGGYVCRNVIAESRGAGHPEEQVVVGAHYDSAPGSPGADDNGSGIAVLIALARNFRETSNIRTIRFVAFANEEPPWFWNSQMGSLVYAEGCRARHDRITAMLSLESVGYYVDTTGSQAFPAGLGFLYPNTGNFVAFVGDLKSRPLVHRAISAFRATSALPSRGAAAPNAIPGVGWSDQWSFWQQGYPGVEVTDTALYRHPFYHTAEDTPERLNYDRMALFTDAIRSTIWALANSDSQFTSKSGKHLR